MQTRYKKCYMLSIINSRREKKLSVFIFALTFDVVVTKLGSTASLRVHRTEKTCRLSGAVLYWWNEGSRIDYAVGKTLPAGITEVFRFSAPQAKFFQKMIKINDFFIEILFSWLFLIYFLSNIIIIMKKFKKWSKTSKISIFFNFFYKNHDKKIMKKLIFAENFSKIRTQRYPLSTKMGFLSIFYIFGRLSSNISCSQKTPT